MIVSKAICTVIFIAALFTIARTRKQAQSPPTGMHKEAVVHMCVCVCVCVCIYIYIVGILLRHKKKTVPFAETWMDIETAILSEISQKNKSAY